MKQRLEERPYSGDRTIPLPRHATAFSLHLSLRMTLPRRIRYVSMRDSTPGAKGCKSRFVLPSLWSDGGDVTYVALSAKADKAIFVELKTEGLARRPKQDAYALRPTGLPSEAQAPACGGAERRMAEREGFEPPVDLRPRLISSQVQSTALPPLRMGYMIFSFGRSWMSMAPTTRRRESTTGMSSMLRSSNNLRT